MDLPLHLQNFAARKFICFECFEIEKLDFLLTFITNMFFQRGKYLRIFKDSRKNNQRNLDDNYDQRLKPPVGIKESSPTS